MTMIQPILKDCRVAMEKAVEAVKREFSSVRSGKASPSMLDQVKVEMYGQMMSMNQTASVSAPEPRLLVVTPFDKPVPAGVPPLDLIVINMSYHDIVNTPADRVAMNKALFDALKPGGKLVIIDNAAKAGAGTTATKTLHRIEEAAVIEEVTRAGFTVDGRSDYLHVADDPREQPFFEMKGKADDKFAVRFVRK